MATVTRRGFTIGTWVRLKYPRREGSYERSQVYARHPEIDRRAVELTRPIRGLRWWNTVDLVKTTPPEGA